MTLKKRLQVLEAKANLPAKGWKGSGALERWKTDHKLGLTLEERETRDLAAWPDDEKAIRDHYAHVRERRAAFERIGKGISDG